MPLSKLRYDILKSTHFSRHLNRDALIKEVNHATGEDFIKILKGQLTHLKMKDKDIAVIVLEQRYGLHGHEAHSLEHVGKLHGISRNVVTRIIGRLLRILGLYFYNKHKIR